MKPEILERKFDIFMSLIGFERVTDDIGVSPPFQNADYISKSDKIIVELKILDKEFFPEGGIIDSLNALIIKPVEINNNGTGIYNFTIPDLNREDKLDNFEEPLRRVLKKANRQIKQTASYYFGSNEDVIGIVILAQLGLRSLSPEITAAIVQKLISLEFSSIQGALVCTPIGSLVDLATQNLNPECASLSATTNPLVGEVVYLMGEQWIAFYENGGFR